jgi:hypothetical protein
MNLKLYKFIGIICFLPVWVFRGNLNYTEIFFIITFIFLIPCVIHFYLVNNLLKKNNLNKHILLSYYISLISLYCLDHNLGLMGMFPIFENHSEQFPIIFSSLNYQLSVSFLILNLSLFLFIFYLRTNGIKILTIFVFTLLLINILDFRKNISSFPEIQVKKVDEINKDISFKKKKLIIIFDEMSGINSLESDHPSGAEFDKNIKSLFKRYNFTYYPNAKSVSSASDISIPTMLNFIDNKKKIKNFENLRKLKKNPLTKKSKNYFIENEIIENKFFDNEENKNIVIYQSLYLDFCKHQKVISCHQYNPFDREYLFIKGFNNNSLSRILSAYTNSLSVIGKFSLRIGRQLNIADSYLDPIGEKAAFPFLLDSIANGLEKEKANLFFVHYLVPHKPYAWNKECHFDGSIESKGNFFQFHYNNIEDQVIQHNIERNCLVYYLSEFLDKLSKKDFWPDLEIFLISDHGARLLAQNENFKSIIFAVKNKRSSPGLSKDIILSNTLFKKLNN